MFLVLIIWACLGYLLSAEARSITWTHEHLICSSMENQQNIWQPPTCHEADYMKSVNYGLKYSTGLHEISVLFAISNLYKDLASKLTPMVISLGENRGLKIHGISFSIPSEFVVPIIPPKFKPSGQLRSGKMLQCWNISNDLDCLEDLRGSLFQTINTDDVWRPFKQILVLASGSLPIVEANDSSLFRFQPLELYQLIAESLDLKGGSRRILFEKSFLNKSLYSTLVASLLQYTHNILSTVAMASFFLRSIRGSGDGSLTPSLPKLLLIQSQAFTETSEVLLRSLRHGMRKILGDHFIVRSFGCSHLSIPPKTTFSTIYSDEYMECVQAEAREEKMLDLVERVHDIVIVASIQEASRYSFWDDLCRHYNPSEVVYIHASYEALTRKQWQKYSKCAGHLFRFVD